MVSVLSFGVLVSFLVSFLSNKMKKKITIILALAFIVSDSLCVPVKASDIDPSNAIEQIAIIVASIVSFLTFIMGSRRVLKFLG